MPLFITTCISRIENATEATRYEQVCNDYLLALDELEKDTVAKNVYVRVVLDPVTVPKAKVVVDTFSLRSKNIESRIYFYSSETAGQGRDEIISDIADAVLHVLRTIRRLCGQKGESIRNLEAAVSLVTLQFLPTWRPDEHEHEEQCDEVSGQGNQRALMIEIPERQFETFDAIVELEEAIECAVHPYGEVDGHDLGLGNVTVFINCDSLPIVSERVREMLRQRGLLETAKLFARDSNSDSPKAIP